MRIVHRTSLSLVAAILSALVAMPAVHCQTFTTIHTFTGTDGANPAAGLVQDRDGHLYGTTKNGGPDASVFFQSGTVFKLTRSGEFSTVHSFGILSGDGASSFAPLLHDGRGTFYGTTESGGDACEDGGQVTCGTVFKLESDGDESIVHTFEGGVYTSDDGANPASGLIADREGNLYGTTYGGYNGSVAFKLTRTGEETILHTFAGGADGNFLYGPLVMDSSGALWGTAYSGGNNTCLREGCGMVFKLEKTASGWTETKTFEFNGTDGSHPYAGLTWDPRRQVFYGITQFGGNLNDCYDESFPAGCGVIFELDRTGTKETVLYSFTGKADGSFPYANLILDPLGDLYGTTPLGGDPTCHCGTVFVRTARGTFFTLHTFTGGADGGYPYGSLLLDMRRLALYGTTYQGGDLTCEMDGSSGCGTVFAIRP